MPRRSVIYQTDKIPSLFNIKIQKFFIRLTKFLPNLLRQRDIFHHQWKVYETFYILHVVREVKSDGIETEQNHNLCSQNCPKHNQSFAIEHKMNQETNQTLFRLLSGCQQPAQIHEL